MSPFTEDEVRNDGDASFARECITSRCFLVSNRSNRNNKQKESTKSKVIKERTRNRKHIFFEDEYELDGKCYHVNSKQSGLYTEIIRPMIKQFEIAKSKWCRVLVYRFDLHMGIYTSDNKLLSNFRKRLNKRIKRMYGFKEIGYCWVREKERSKFQHYHWVLFLDGNLIKHPGNLNLIIKESWESQTGRFHMPVVPSPYYFVDSEEVERRAIHRISYLAKARGKGYRNKQAKDFQCSRMKPKVRTKL